MGNSNTTLRFVAVAVAVIAVAFCIGFFIIGGSRTQPTAQTTILAPTPLPGAGVTPPPKRVAALGPRLKNGDYTAPGAPRIRIVEERTPSLTDTSQQQPQPEAAVRSAPARDSEASQEAPPKPKRAADVTPDAAPDGAGTDTGTPDTPPDNADPAPPPGADAGTDTGSGRGDSEATQEGGATQFRVQTGSFEAARNARALADALRDRGYVTSTRAERDGARTVYKVQVGSYRTRAAADKAAQDLQSSGYPAYVSPAGQ